MIDPCRSARYRILTCSQHGAKRHPGMTMLTQPGAGAKPLSPHSASQA
jgi:hypothetical protein